MSPFTLPANERSRKTRSCFEDLRYSTRLYGERKSVIGSCAIGTSSCASSFTRCKACSACNPGPAFPVEACHPQIVILYHRPGSILLEIHMSVKRFTGLPKSPFRLQAPLLQIPEKHSTSAYSIQHSMELGRERQEPGPVPVKEPRRVLDLHEWAALLLASDQRSGLSAQVSRQ